MSFCKRNYITVPPDTLLPLLDNILPFFATCQREPEHTTHKRVCGVLKERKRGSLSSSEN